MPKTSYTHPEYLVETEWLEQHLHDPELRLFDVTGMLTADFVNLAAERSYAAGHIPGAAFLDVAGRDQSMAAPGAALPWTWPSPEDAAKMLAQCGIGNDSRVVLYGASPRPGVDKGTMWATRAWWVMHSFGARCAVLNGGWEKWVAEGRPTSTKTTGYPSATFTVAATAPARVANKEEVLSAITDPSVCIVDALSAESYAGTSKVAYGPRRGHIKGSKSLPMESVLAPDGTFLAAPDLEAKLRADGILDAERVVTYCGGGIAATVDAFALALLGHRNVAVYDASLFEWANDPDLPMETT